MPYNFVLVTSNPHEKNFLLLGIIHTGLQITIKLEILHLLHRGVQNIELSSGERLPGHERDLGTRRYGQVSAGGRQGRRSSIPDHCTSTTPPAIA